ncbi:hypothetical protein [uncultured Paraglaciecola sp.]|uniref:hypothetical protein n=1 Tax=uncultured Paraglaciecola sp. TaxID=1765024 RepID=UPI0025919A62|nr:hypothetical protein [uncultured Paraglaciecola sp.]
MSEKNTSKSLIFIVLLVAVGVVFAIITMTEEKENTEGPDNSEVIIETQPTIEPKEEVKAEPKPIEPKEELKADPKPIESKAIPEPKAEIEIQVAPEPTEPKEEAEAEPEPILPTWDIFESENETTGEKTAIAYSPDSYPEPRMQEPYSDIKGWMVVRCDSGFEWSYFGFSTPPSIAKSTKKDGYDKMIAKVSWDGKVENLILNQKWGDRFLSFKESVFAIKKIQESNSVSLELDWEGQSNLRFTFSLNGAPAALEKVRAMCANY